MPTLLPFSSHQRQAIIELVTERHLAEMHKEDLELFFYSVYSSMLDEYTDEALRSKLEEVATDEELADFAVVEAMRTQAAS